MRIDLGIFTFLILFAVHSFGAAAESLENATSTPMIRRTLQQRGNGSRRRSKRECIAVMFVMQYEDHRHVDEPLGCELLGEDLNGKPYDMVRIKGMTSDWARKNNVTSGATTIFVPSGADIDDSMSQLVIPTGSTIKLGRRDKKKRGVVTASSQTSVMDPGDVFWNRNLATVVKTVLVIRIEAQDEATTLTESELANKIFGASGDKINLSSRFRDCSDGQMLMRPVPTNTLIGTDGVYTIRLPTYNVTGVKAQTVVSAAVTVATAALKTHPKNLANHVIVCVPPGTIDGRWIAYASINSWLSAYNDLWCQYPSALMHEIGHNLGLDHAGEGADEYGDNTGVMGSAYGGDDEGPLMCFNAANTWQLGWYTDYRVDLPDSVTNSFVWSGSLVGFAEKSSAIASDRMMIRIRSASDYYIHFNRQIGMNNGTKEGFNKVLVTSRATGLGPAKSTLLAKLAANGVHSFPIVDGSNIDLTVTVTAMSLTDVPARASISINFRGLAPSTDPTSMPATARSNSPTIATTKSPTRAPSKSTTAAPPKSPTRKPTKPSCNNNGKCEPGENCVSCRSDCRGGNWGYPITNPMCCIGGACATRCSDKGWRCT